VSLLLWLIRIALNEGRSMAQFLRNPDPETVALFEKGWSE
jgi:hypothetical protein